MNGHRSLIRLGLISAVALGAALFALALPVFAEEEENGGPTFASARTNADGTYVIVTFSEDIMLSPAALYATAKFNVPFYQFAKAVMDVTVDGIDDVLNDEIYISGDELWLYLSFPVGSSDVIKVSYDNPLAEDGGGIFVDSAGNAVPFFSDQPVTNNSTESADIDRTPDFDLSVDDLEISEDGSGTYTITLTSQPSENVRVRASPFGTLSTNVSSVNFTTENWNTPKTVTVTPQSDDDDSLNAWGIVRHYIAERNNDYWIDLRVLVTDNDTPLNVSGASSAAYAENGTEAVGTYSVTNAGDSTISWSLLGTDSSEFSISSAGVLSFDGSPDYENPSDENEDNVYLLFIDAASDSSTGFLPVVVTVTDTNDPATGAPMISGTAQVGQTLTADTSGISDADGLANVSYNYQWLGDDLDIEGATSSTYTVQATDEGKVIKVRVTFTDDGGSDETVTSAGTSAVVVGGL